MGKQESAELAKDLLRIGDSLGKIFRCGPVVQAAATSVESVVAVRRDKGKTVFREAGIRSENNGDLFQE